MITFPAGELGRRHSYAAGVLIRDRRGRFLCAPYGRRHWRRTRNGTLVGLGGIGGSMEPGERPHQTARREAREEIGCAVRLAHAARTFLADGAGRLREVRYPERPAPVLLVRRPSARRAYAPGHPVSDRSYIVIFRGSVPPAEVRLDPSDEVEALIWLPPSLVTHGSLLLDIAIERAISVEELVASGGEIALGRLPRNAKLVLSGEYPLLARVLRGA